MALISRLKALLGLDGGRRRSREAAVTVEREPAADAERAVKESPATSPAEASDEPAPAEASDDPVQSIKGVGPAYADRLAEAGVETVGDLAAADAAALAEETGIGEGRVSGWIERARTA
ncbi:MAG: helix-hairpin-helix domain-containing protein [Halobacteriales archaeon]